MGLNLFFSGVEPPRIILVTNTQAFKDHPYTCIYWQTMQAGGQPFFASKYLNIGLIAAICLQWYNCRQKTQAYAILLFKGHTNRYADGLLKSAHMKNAHS